MHSERYNISISLSDLWFCNVVNTNWFIIFVASQIHIKFYHWSNKRFALHLPIEQFWPFQPSLQKHRPSVYLHVLQFGKRTVCTIILRLASVKKQIEYIYWSYAQFKKNKFTIIRYYFKKYSLLFVIL